MNRPRARPDAPARAHPARPAAWRARMPSWPRPARTAGPQGTPAAPANEGAGATWCPPPPSGQGSPRTAVAVAASRSTGSSSPRPACSPSPVIALIAKVRGVMPGPAGMVVARGDQAVSVMVVTTTGACAGRRTPQCQRHPADHPSAASRTDAGRAGNPAAVAPAADSTSTRPRAGNMRRRRRPPSAGAAPPGTARRRFHPPRHRPGSRIPSAASAFSGVTVMISLLTSCRQSGGVPCGGLRPGQSLWVPGPAAAGDRRRRPALCSGSRVKRGGHPLARAGPVMVRRHGQPAGGWT